MYFVNIIKADFIDRSYMSMWKFSKFLKETFKNIDHINFYRYKYINRNIWEIQVHIKNDNKETELFHTFDLSTYLYEKKDREQTQRSDDYFSNIAFIPEMYFDFSDNNYKAFVLKLNRQTDKMEYQEMLRFK